MQKIYYDILEIDQHSYVIGATKKGLAFVGSRDGSIDEIKQFYDCQLFHDHQQVAVHAKQLEEYLTGKRQAFNVNTDISGTSFQKDVWQALKKIPYGAVTNYTEIAQAIGRPKASRAVGSAIGKNPLLMVIPCHRVLTKAGQLGGYRGGVAMKKSLLDLERK